MDQFRNILFNFLGFGIFIDKSLCTDASFFVARCAISLAEHFSLWVFRGDISPFIQMGCRKSSKTWIDYLSYWLQGVLLGCSRVNSLTNLDDAQLLDKTGDCPGTPTFSSKHFKFFFYRRWALKKKGSSIYWGKGGVHYRYNWPTAW